MGSDGLRWMMPCPSSNKKSCELRVLYINHSTKEATLQCPCAVCSPEWNARPCVTLGSLFGEDDPRFLDEDSNPLIPSQDLTRVGEPCWRLGDLFNEDRTDRLEPEEESVIPAQDVGLDIFDDMPGFALTRNHLTLTTHDPPLLASTPEPQSHAAVGPSDLGLPPSRTTSVSTKSLFSMFVSHTVTRSPRSPDDSQIYYLREVLEAFVGLVLSVLLVVVYECVSIYIYIKDLPRAPLFLSKLVLLVLLGVGLRILKSNFGLV